MMLSLVLSSGRKASSACHPLLLGNTAQYACGIFRKNCAMISSLFLAIHKVFLRKSAIIRTRFFSESALAALCGIAFTKLGFNNETGYHSLPEYIERLKGPQRCASYRGSALHSPRRFPVCNAPRRRNSRRQRG